MMKENDHILETLEQVERVPVPPFLLTRIEAGIESLEAERIPMRRVLAASFILAVVFGLNTFFFVDQFTPSDPVTNSVNLIEEMGFGNSNQLYHE